MSDLRVAAVSLPCQPGTPAAARRFVRQFFGAHPLLDTVELLVSEVVSNALLHAHSAVEVSASAGDDRIRVEVADTSTQAPTRRAPDLDGGYGLKFLDVLATNWGVEYGHRGKSVWFEIADQSDVERPNRQMGQPDRPRQVGTDRDHAVDQDQL